MVQYNKKFSGTKGAFLLFVQHEHHSIPMWEMTQVLGPAGVDVGEVCELCNTSQKSCCSCTLYIHDVLSFTSFVDLTCHSMIDVLTSRHVPMG